MSADAAVPTFGQQHFGAADLGDRRRTARLVDLAEAFGAHPAGSLPEKCASPARYQALLGLLERDEVTHARVLAPHLARTHALLRGPAGPTVLALFDIVELDFTSRSRVAAQLAPIGDGRGRGFECFHGLAVAADTREALGLVYQELYLRPPAKAPGAKAETKAEGRRRADRQSRLWKRGPAALPEAAGGRVVAVFDAEGATTEALAALVGRGQAFVTRLTCNRRCFVGHAAAGPAAAAKVHDHLRGLTPQGRRAVRVTARPGRAARDAACALTWAAVRLRPPRPGRGEHGREPLAVWAVRVAEEAPPAGEAALDWFLVTNVEVAGPDQAAQRCAWYEARIVVEEYHKGLKTGCGVEGPRVTTRGRLEPLLALLSVVAVQLLRLRDAGRLAAAGPAAAVVGRAVVAVVSRLRYGEERGLSVAEFLLALARLGGHLNRKADGPPGWQTLWKGWMKVQAALELWQQLQGGHCD